MTYSEALIDRANDYILAKTLAEMCADTEECPLWRVYVGMSDKQGSCPFGNTDNNVMCAEIKMGDWLVALHTNIS